MYIFYNNAKSQVLFVIFKQLMCLIVFLIFTLLFSWICTFPKCIVFITIYFLFEMKWHLPYKVEIDTYFVTMTLLICQYQRPGRYIYLKCTTWLLSLSILESFYLSSLIDNTGRTRSSHRQSLFIPLELKEKETQW